MPTLGRWARMTEWIEEVARRLVVGRIPGGVDFGFETAQVYSFVLEPDFGPPFVHTFIKKDADVYRCGFCFDFTPVMYVL